MRRRQIELIETDKPHLRVIAICSHVLMYFVQFLHENMHEMYPYSIFSETESNFIFFPDSNRNRNNMFISIFCVRRPAKFWRLIFVVLKELFGG